MKHFYKVLPPFLLGLFPILWLYVNNKDQLRLEDVLSTIVIVILLIMIGLLLVYILQKNIEKTSVIISFFLLLFFSYNHINYALDQFIGKIKFSGDENNVMQNSSFAQLRLFGWFILVVFFLLIIKKIHIDLNIANQLFLVIGLSGLLSVGYIWLSMEINQPQSNSEKFIKQWLQESKNTNMFFDIPTPLPDIYYIILDGMGREDILREKYHLDIRGLVDQLQDVGFYLATKSTSNYAKTDLSLASSLNFMYLDDISEVVGVNTTSQQPLEIAIEKNRLFSILKKAGYKIATFNDIYTLSNITSVDYYLKPGFLTLNGFQNTLINTTPLNDLASLFSTNDLYDLHRVKITFTYDQLEKLSRKPEPIFVLAHIFAPHPPFVFDAQGNPTQPQRDFTLDDGNDFIEFGSRDEYIEGYREQTIYILLRTIETVSAILENSYSPTIIVIQGDHGPRSKIDWTNNMKPDLLETMSIFNAYLFPDKNYSQLYEEITPVNTFRIILNQYFGANMELLEDRNYYQFDDRPYYFTDITHRLIGSENQPVH